MHHGSTQPIARTDLGERKPLIIRRVDAIPVGCRSKKAVAMAGVTVSCALNILVRIEAATGPSAGVRQPPRPR